MKLLRTKPWHWSDIWQLKWSAFLFGTAAGAFFAGILQPYLLVLLVFAVVLAVKPARHYFRD